MIMELKIAPARTPWFLLAVALLLASSCTNTAATSGPAKTLCPESRPEVCAAIYAPVCGVTETGERSTFPSGCKACTRPDIVGYFPGRCEDQTGEE